MCILFEPFYSDLEFPLYYMYVYANYIPSILSVSWPWLPDVPNGISTAGITTTYLSTFILQWQSISHQTTPLLELGILDTAVQYLVKTMTRNLSLENLSYCLSRHWLFHISLSLPLSLSISLSLALSQRSPKVRWFDFDFGYGNSFIRDTKNLLFHTRIDFVS